MFIHAEIYPRAKLHDARERTLRQLAICGWPLHTAARRAPKGPRL
jgi:hypothetical protein